jgi:hypothetical protein
MPNTTKKQALMIDRNLDFGVSKDCINVAKKTPTAQGKMCD